MPLRRSETWFQRGNKDVDASSMTAATDPALCKRLAEFMGYGWCEDDGCSGVFIAFDGSEIDWNPPENIAQAMMVAERIGGLALDDNRHDRDNGWCATFYGERKVPDFVADTPALAICLAADAWLRQGGER